MNQFFHVCDCKKRVQEDKSGVQDCVVLAMSVLCLTLICCLCRQHANLFRRLCVSEIMVPFVLIDPTPDNFPMLTVCFARYDRCHTYIDCLIFVPLSLFSLMSGSAPQAPNGASHYVCDPSWPCLALCTVAVVVVPPRSTDTFMDFI